jgi:hypothetical protein
MMLYICYVNNDKQTHNDMSFTDLLKNPAFCADLADYEMHAAQGHPAAEDLWEHIRDTYGYEI